MHNEEQITRADNLSEARDDVKMLHRHLSDEAEMFLKRVTRLHSLVGTDIQKAELYRISSKIKSAMEEVNYRLSRVLPQVGDEIADLLMPCPMSEDELRAFRTRYSTTKAICADIMSREFKMNLVRAAYATMPESDRLPYTSFGVFVARCENLQPEAMAVARVTLTDGTDRDIEVNYLAGEITYRWYENEISADKVLRYAGGLRA